MMEIRPAGPEDLGAIRTLLAVCLLPVQDIGSCPVRFVVAESDRGIIGVGGLEFPSTALALMRSVAVMPGYRKQHVGRRIVNRLMTLAQDEGVERVFLLTETAADYFSHIGFAPVGRDKIPAEIAATTSFARIGSRNTTAMVRNARMPSAGDATRAFAAVGAAAQTHFDAGYYCAESVLLAVAERAGIHSPLLPAIATGFCNGIARTWGTCGALNGGVMAINLVYGRKAPGEPVAQNYTAVRKLIDEFGKSCGALNCSELLACDLDTKDGRRTYEELRLKNHCREYVGTAARIAASIVQQKIDLRDEDEAGRTRAAAA